MCFQLVISGICFFLAEHFESTFNCSIFFIFFFFPLLSMQLSWAAGGASVCAGQQPAEGGSLLPPQPPARGLLEEHQEQHSAPQGWGLPWKKCSGPLQIPEHTSHGWVDAARLSVEGISRGNADFARGKSVLRLNQKSQGRSGYLILLVTVCQNPECCESSSKNVSE